MAKRVVVYSAEPNAESAHAVVTRLRAKQVEIVDEQQHMLLVNGTQQHVRKALGDVHGWRVGPLTTTPPPSTRHKVMKSPA